jgi:hypothetical protein
MLFREIAMPTNATPEIQRTMLSDGTVQMLAGNCAFIYRRLCPGVLLISITGDDHGQFGSATLDEVAGELTRFGQPLLLYFDLRETRGPTTQVMEMWTAWFANHKHELRRVVLLAPAESRVLHLSVSIAQHLSRTGNLIRICGDVAEFKRAIFDERPDLAPIDLY